MRIDWPWTQAVRWTDVLPDGKSVAMTADETMLARVADGLDVKKIESLEADLRILPWLDGLEIEGILRARVIRICGVSLEPFEEVIDDPVAQRFVPWGSPNAAQLPEGDVELDLDADDPPDSVAGDAVDLGSYLVEQLALALSPFPRKPGAEFHPPESTGSLSPFAALARLRTALPDDGE